jgi:hypothetical protein
MDHETEAARTSLMCRGLPAETENFVFVQPARANGFWQEITDAYQATEIKFYRSHRITRLAEQA